MSKSLARAPGKGVTVFFCLHLGKMSFLAEKKVTVRRNIFLKLSECACSQIKETERIF